MSIFFIILYSVLFSLFSLANNDSPDEKWIDKEAFIFVFTTTFYTMLCVEYQVIRKVVCAKWIPLHVHAPKVGENREKSTESFAYTIKDVLYMIKLNGSVWYGVVWLKNETTMNLDLQPSIVVALFCLGFPHSHSIPFSRTNKTLAHNASTKKHQRKKSEIHLQQNIKFGY